MNVKGFDNKDQEDEFKEVIDKSAEVRLIIDDEQSKLRSVGRIYSKIYGIPFNLFMLIHRANYFKTPTLEQAQKNKPSKLEKSITDFADTVKYMRSMNMEIELEKYLKKNGIEVKEDVPVVITSNSSELAKYENDIKSQLNISPLPNDDLMLSELMFKRAYEIQDKMNSLNESVNNDTAKSVKDQLNIEKQHFINAVKITADKKRLKKVKKKIEKSEHDVQSIVKSISVFPEFESR